MIDGTPIGLLLTLTYATAIVYTPQIVAIVLDTDDNNLALNTGTNSLVINSDDGSGIIVNEVT